MVNIIVAVNQLGAIGYQNELMYYMPNDLKRFKSLTTGHTVIMGRRTFESLPKGALPNRRNIVISGSGRRFEGAETFTSLSEAVSDALGRGEEVFIIGGASIYRLGLPMADRLLLTLIDDDKAPADTFFPEIDTDEWIEVARTDGYADEKHAYNYHFVDYVRKA